MQASHDLPRRMNVFGLIDPRRLLPALEPQDRGALLYSPVTETILRGLEQWILDHSDVMVTSRGRQKPLCEAGVPDLYKDSCEYRRPPTMTLADFPAAEDLAAWWDARPEEMRDPDGFEMIRLQVALWGGAADLIESIHGKISIKASKRHLEYLTQWIRMLRPGEDSRGNWREYIMDAAESAYARLPLPRKYLHRFWYCLAAERLLRQQDCPDEILRRFWALVRCPGHPASTRTYGFGTGYFDTIEFYRRGIARADEVLWEFVTQGRLEDVMGGGFIRGFVGEKPELVDMARRVRSQVVELQIQRGEEQGEWSHACRIIWKLEGCEILGRLFKALGKSRPKFSRPDIYKFHFLSKEKTWDTSRQAVLTHLIAGCLPNADDTVEMFRDIVSKAGMSTLDLLRLSVFRPVWAPLVEQATGAGGLCMALGWIFIHSNYFVDRTAYSQAMRLEKDRGAFPRASDEFPNETRIADPIWFEQACLAVGTQTMEALLDTAAKLGHQRPRLFADALLGKTTAEQLEKRFKRDCSSHIAMAIGLVPLPEQGEARQAQILRRYGMLLAHRERCLKFRNDKPKGYPVFQAALMNLARSAGFKDAQSFERETGIPVSPLRV